MSQSENLEVLKILEDLLSSSKNASKEEKQEEETLEEGWVLSAPPHGWAYLPEIVLEDIFLKLTFKERHLCSQVCRSWYDAFYLPRLWKELVVTPRSFTYKRININRFTREEREVSKAKVMTCFYQVGHHFRRIAIESNSNFHNMSKVMQALGQVLSRCSDGEEGWDMTSLREFEFEFACETRDLWSDDLKVIGTGGGMLKEMKHVLAHLHNIQQLRFNNLCLSNFDAVGFLDEFAAQNKQSLRKLEILNLTRLRHPLTSAARFTHLQHLLTSPAHLSDYVVLTLTRNSHLRRLQVVHDRYTDHWEAVSADAWFEVKLTSPQLRVTLECRGRVSNDVILQPAAPVDCVMYTGPSVQVSTQTVIQLIDEYRATLESYGKAHLHRQRRPHSFHDRADSALVLLVRECRRLRTLVISERVSTATILIIAHEARNLQQFHVRRNAVVLKCDWPKLVAWSDAFYARFRRASRDYDRCEREVAMLMRKPSWKMLTDREFKRLQHKMF